MSENEKGRAMEKLASLVAKKYGQGVQNMGTCILFPNDKFVTVEQVRSYLDFTKFTKQTARKYHLKTNGLLISASIENTTYGVWCAWLKIEEVAAV